MAAIPCSGDIVQEPGPHGDLPDLLMSADGAGADLKPLLGLCGLGHDLPSAVLVLPLLQHSVANGALLPVVRIVLQPRSGDVGQLFPSTFPTLPCVGIPDLSGAVRIGKEFAAVALIEFPPAGLGAVGSLPGTGMPLWTWVLPVGLHWAYRVNT